MTTEHTYTNDWPEIIAQLDKLSHTAVAIGYFGDSADSKLLTIVKANEYGAHIQPKNGSWLTIPTKDTPMGTDGGPMSARDIPGLFRPQGKNVLATSNGNGDLKIMFYLVKEVTIPARPFIRTAMIENQNKYRNLIIKGINGIMSGDTTANQLLMKLGAIAVADIQKKMIGWSDPGNAPATVERKGSNNPLVDKGILTRSVKFVITEGWQD